MAGGPGFTLSIAGSGFDGEAVAQWSGTPLTTTFVSAEQLTAAVPADLIANAGTPPVTVVADGTTSNSVTVTIANQAPTIGALQPSAAMAGGGSFTLTVDGVNFASDAAVQWNGTALPTQFDDAGQLTATVPGGLPVGSPAVTVLSGGVTSNPATFTVIGPQPVIGLLEPAAVVAGGAAFTLTVTGGFGAGDFALQMVKAPERQSFIPGQTGEHRD
jgi:hypothetical protein